jgi:hypothetical protein
VGVIVRRSSLVQLTSGEHTLTIASKCSGLYRMLSIFRSRQRSCSDSVPSPSSSQMLKTLDAAC